MKSMTIEEWLGEKYADCTARLNGRVIESVNTGIEGAAYTGRWSVVFADDPNHEYNFIPDGALTMVDVECPNSEIDPQGEKFTMFEIELMDSDLPNLIIEDLSELENYQDTLGLFFGDLSEKEILDVGTQVTITVIEMTRSEIDALPEYWDV
jgi:hypothetical protein